MWSTCFVFFYLFIYFFFFFFFFVDMSEELLQHYENYSTLQHPGGHFLPAASPQKKVYIQFLEQQIENKKKNHRQTD